jgi:cytochrome c-type biogenesis protein
MHPLAEKIMEFGGIRSPAGRVAAFVILAVVVLGAVAIVGVLHPTAPDPELRRYLPALTLFTVVSAGLLDGVNPCAFTVLLLLVAALLASTQAGSYTAAGLRGRVVLLGSVYVGAVFVTYLALGVGLVGAGRLFTGSHLPSRLGAFAAVLLGLWMIKDVLLPEVGPRLEAPHQLTVRAKEIARRGSVPALVVGGILIGLCTIPCSGAIYLAVLSLLAAEANPLRAYSYLVLYNVLFVAPLLAILLIASSRKGLAHLARWQERHRERVRFILGTSVIALGLTLLVII